MLTIKPRARAFHSLYRLSNYCISWYQFFAWILLSPHHRKEARSLPLPTLMKLLYRGFFPNKYRLFQLNTNDWRLYVSDRQNLMSSHIDDEYGIMLHDKFLFGLAMQHIADVPRTYALIHGGRSIWLDCENETDRDLHTLVQQKKRIILKPIDKNGGRGVILLEYKNNGCWKNGQAIDNASLQGIIAESDNAIVTEFIQQGMYANTLYPNTVNTIRLLTMLDPQSQLPFIAAAVQRVGCKKSIPVDNLASGGMSCNIDLQTGQLGKAYSKSQETPVRWIERHPDTNILFEDQIIPNWKSICRELLDIADKLPMLPYIAWDIAILDDGITIIEGNRWSDLDFFQVSQPLLTDQRIRKFFSHHKTL